MHTIRRAIKFSAVFYLITVLSGCAGGSRSGAIPDSPTTPRRVAVWDIVDYSATASASTEAGDILTSKIIETIQGLPNTTVVEREKLTLALSELNIGSAAIADPETQLKLGEILGASDMVFGGYQVFGDMMRLDIRLVNVETGKVLKAVDKTIPASDMSAWLTDGEAAAKELFQ